MSFEVEKPKAVADASWGRERRLEFIDFRLLWDGRLNRAELVEFFGTSIQQASLDLARYMGLAPENLDYDRSRKVYKATDRFRPVFVQADARAFLSQLSGATTGTWPKALSFLGWRPPFDLVPQPVRSISPNTLIRLLWAIRDQEELEVTYQAMSEAQPTRRWLAPHAIASDGSRWHARAWCHTRGIFKDFVLARIQTIHAARRTETSAQDDVEWQTRIDIVLQASRALTVGQRKAVEIEFGMRAGRLVVKTRRALLPYFIRQWRLESPGNSETRLPLLECVNASALSLKNPLQPTQNQFPFQGAPND